MVTFDSGRQRYSMNFYASHQRPLQRRSYTGRPSRPAEGQLRVKSGGQPDIARRPVSRRQPTWRQQLRYSARGQKAKCEPSCVARNDVEQMRQYKLWRIIKWPFADPDGSHSLVEAFCRRFGVDHQGTGFQLLGTPDGRLEKQPANAAFPKRWIDKDAVAQIPVQPRGTQSEIRRLLQIPIGQGIVGQTVRGHQQYRERKAAVSVHRPAAVRGKVPPRFPHPDLRLSTVGWAALATHPTRAPSFDEECTTIATGKDYAIGATSP